MFRRFAVALGVLWASLAVVVAQPTPAEKKADSAPPNTIIAVYDSLAEALKKVPRAILLTPEQYQQLLDEIERLKKAAETPRLRVPSKCHISGKIDGNLAVLTVKFELETDQAATAVRLGFGQGSATGVRLGGRTPALVNESSKNGNGFVVEIDRPGDHTLELDLVVPLSVRPGGVGLLLDLPRAAITSLDLTLPPNSRDIRLGGKTPAESRLSVNGNQIKSDSLGPLERLELVWGSTQGMATGPILAVEGVIQVRVEAKQTTTDALLTLRVLGGKTRQWPLLLPPDAEVSVEASQSERVERIDNNGKGPRVVRLKSETTEPLTLRVRHRSATPRPGSGRVAIGPFSVVGAASHTGQLLIHNNAPEYHLDLYPAAELRRRAPTEEESRKEPQLVSVFTYGPSTPATAWLEIEPDTVRGQLKIRPAHTLRLADDGDPGPAWLVETELTVTPRWAEVDRLLVTMPAGCEWLSDASYPLPERVRSLSYDPTQRQVLFRLNRAAEPTPFKVRLTCRVQGEVDLGRIGLALVPLPRAVGIIEPDSSLKIVVPPRVRAVPADNPSGLELIRQTSQELLYRCPRRPPERVAVAWGPFRPEVQVERIVDVTLGNSHRVRQELIFTLPPGETCPTPQRVRFSPLLTGRLLIRQGEARLDGDFLLVPLRGEGPTRVVLDYDLPADQHEQCLLPLLTPEQSDRLETRVRVWTEAGRLPSAVPDEWTEGHIEAVADRDRLPLMVLTSRRPLSTLALTLQREVKPSRVLIDRALVRVDLSQQGLQEYRVRYRLTRLSEPFLDLELPAALASLGLQVTLQGKAVEPLPLLADRPDLKGRLIRLKLAPELLREGAILECLYQLSSEATQTQPLSTPLYLPRIRDDSLDFPTRWLILLPEKAVPLRPELGGFVPRSWKRSGWLFVPSVQCSVAELEQWLTEQPDAAVEADEAAAEEPAPVLVLWRGSEPSLTLVLVPRQAWLIVCSATLVLVVLLVMRLLWSHPEGRPSPWLWPMLLALGTLVVLVGVFLPHLGLQMLYGIQPALVVLALLVPIGWVLAERKRRQVVFLANFRRSTSSLAKASGETQGSTVDVPPRAASNALDRSGGVL